MNLEQNVRHRLTGKEIGIMAHVIAGYPSYADNFQALEIMAKYNVDLIEIQMPFSEPIADGPIFVHANQEALKRGATIDKYFHFMEKVTSNFDFFVLMMGYYNPVFKMGEEIFLDRLQAVRGYGFILPDLPFGQDQSLFQMAKARNLSPILMMTPDTPDERLKQLGEAGSGFIYVVARKGVTGASTHFSADFNNYIARCHRATTLPLAVGFGISCKADLDFLTGRVEIAIIGTAALQAWERKGKTGLDSFFKQLML